jgi:SAM-dependent methyltransferase
MPLTEASPKARPTDSWYLDPLVARQKAEANRACVRRWGGESARGVVLKTDLFEEANGDDHILADLGAEAGSVVGMDCVSSTVSRAARRFRFPGHHFTVTDLRALNFADSTFDLIVSTSTLDHFDERADFVEALKELDRVLRPGGRMILVLDNPLNPTYLPLKWICRWLAPYRLGYATSRRNFCAALQNIGLEIVDSDYLIHNPRMFSTAMFLVVRRLLGRHAERLIEVLVQGFALLGRLPTRPVTACFSVVCAQKPAAQHARMAAEVAAVGRRAVRR